MTEERIGEGKRFNRFERGGDPFSLAFFDELARKCSARKTLGLAPQHRSAEEA